MITSKKVRKLVKTFERVLPYARRKGASLNMDSAVVSRPVGSNTPACQDHKCGTVHCHAGWYLLAKMWDGKAEYLPAGRHYYYDVGARMMAQDLGLLCGYALKYWARDNPDLWGNDRGNEMFIGMRAFSPDGMNVPESSLDAIVDHWRQVADALELAEIGGVI